MGTKRIPSDAMKDMYRSKREDTLNRISNAIRDMKNWGEPVTKKRIMERANVSSGTLSKPYVLELLKKEKVCQFQEIGGSTEKHTDAVKELSLSIAESKRLASKLLKANEQIEKLKNQRDNLKDEIKKITEENKLLRGQRQLLLERMQSADISIGNIKL